MSNTAADQLRVAGWPGTTASGIASASQLVERTPSTTFRADMSASPSRLVVFLPLQVQAPMATPLVAEDYPVLAAIWDNEEDDIFDTI